MRGVDCVCATEPPFSSGNKVSDAGAAATERALEKNTTLKILIPTRGLLFFVFVFGRGVDCGLWCAGCCLFVVGVEGRVRGVDCVCATEPPYFHQTDT